jgi:selenocysteine-specific elongation factor
MDEIVDRVLATLGANETEKPWAFGMTSLGLARLLGVDEPALLPHLTAALDGGLIVTRSGYFATPSFAPELSAEQRAFFDAALAPDAVRPNVPLGRAALVAAMRSAKIPGLDLALDTLFASGALVPVGDDLYRRAQIAVIRAFLEAEVQARGHVTVAQFRDAIGTTRKYAVPLLEWFDATGVTVREGDNRHLAPASALLELAGD